MSIESVSSVLTSTLTEDGICTLTINRPEAMNSLNGELVQKLHDTFYELRYDSSVRVVLLTGGEGPAFCAGADLKERRSMSEADVRRRIEDYGFTFNLIETLPKPVICSINGYAFGGGLELALACDLRIVAADTQVGLTELQLGIIPGAGGTQRLTRLIGPARAKELIFTAARISGLQAVEYGLANYACPYGEMSTRAEELARQMLRSAPVALAQAKRAIDIATDVDLRSGLQFEAAAYGLTLPTEDRKEGLIAFKEKRAPNFKGK